MPLEMKPLQLGDRRLLVPIIVGQATCTHCNQPDLSVVNDKGNTGDKRFNYLENHYPEGKHDLCIGSEKFLSDF